MILLLARVLESETSVYQKTWRADVLMPLQEDEVMELFLCFFINKGGKGPFLAWLVG